MPDAKRYAQYIHSVADIARTSHLTQTEGRNAIIII